jgi:hypothetical protein
LEGLDFRRLLVEESRDLDLGWRRYDLSNI